jgi:hypothetical protein
MTAGRRVTLKFQPFPALLEEEEDPEHAVNRGH